ncbi:hypothetical protein [Mucilaginibacter pineti]|nr:hypothetical protein [Mucilaginibacter pineti]
MIRSSKYSGVLRSEGTDILPNSYTLAKDLYFDLMNDYLMTLFSQA